ALQLLQEVDRKEQEYVKARQAKQELYQASLDLWQGGDVSAALTKLEKLLELDQRVPDTSAPERGAIYQNFYNQVRSEHDAIKNSYAEARKHLEDGNFAQALAICNEYLTKHPGHALFQALQFDVEERHRQGLSAQIAEVDRKVETEPDLERKVNILKEALDQFPGESHFERALRLMKDKRDLVNSIVTKARNHEERGQFNEALGQWDVLKTIYSQYPGLGFEIERVTKRRDQQLRSEAKAKWVEQIDRQLELTDYARVQDLLKDALAEFPDDAELMSLQKLAQQGVARAAEAQQLLAQAEQSCAEGKIEEGIEVLRKAQQLDERNFAIRAALLDKLLERARAVLDTDWQVAENLTQQALDLDPSHALAKSLRTLALDKKREAFVDKCVARARELQSLGDLHGAVREAEQGLSEYPREMRLAQLYNTLTKVLPETQRTTKFAPTGEQAEPGAAAAPVLDAIQMEATVAGPVDPLRWQARQNDLEELRRLDQSAETIVDPSQMRFVSERAQAIARQHPEDPDVKRAADDLEQHLATVTIRMKKEPEAAAPPTAAAPATARAPIPGVQPQPAEPPKAVPMPPALQAAAAPAPAAAAKPAATPKPTAPSKATAPRAAGKTPKWILPAVAAVVLAVIGAVVVPKLRKPTAPTGIAVEIRTTPAGATIKINNEARGTSNLKLDLAPGQYQLEVQLDGYQPAVSSINPAPGAPVALDLTLQPLPQSVRLFTDIEGGKVSLDDQPAGELQEGQFVLDNVAPGQHTLKVSAGREEATITFEAKPGAAPVLTAPVAAKELVAVLVSNLGGKAQVQSSVTPVKVGLDGQPAGEVGPNGLALNNVALGNHELTLGEGKDERKMIIGVGAAPSLDVFLRSDRNVGTLVVVTGEDNVKVFLNDKEQRRATRRGQLRIPNLGVQKYVVRVVKEGFQSDPEQRVEIRKGDESKVEFKLRPVPTVASLSIRGAMPGTQVFLEGRSVGTVEADGSFSQGNLTPGDHTLELRKDQYRTKRLAKRFTAGETVQLSGGDVAMERAIGTLRLNVSPAESRVTLNRQGEAPRPITDTTLTLPEGTYTLTARAPNYAEKTVTVQLGGGETKTVDLGLSREKAATTTTAAVSKGGMSDWENPSEWRRDGNWFVHKGGNAVPFRITPTAGTFVFTAQLRKGRRLQWFLNRANEKNYALFQVDKKFFYRNLVVDGKSNELAKVNHGLKNPEYYTIQIDVTPTGVVHKIHDGEKWITLDEWVDASRRFSEGKFGVLIPGSDQVALSNFSFTPK
ncbi:MAG: PEGA domain-containing protein, partial [Acidobacteria bacterium]|nr:PEGA domain-containing protein [Acidobacteriota bacterium]